MTGRLWCGWVGVGAAEDVGVPERASAHLLHGRRDAVALQRGLAGGTFGHFLIKQVAEEISRELARISTFVTLSPIPAFAAWLKRERASEAPILPSEDHTILAEQLIQQ